MTAISASNGTRPNFASLVNDSIISSGVVFGNESALIVMKVTKTSKTDAIAAEAPNAAIAMSFVAIGSKSAGF
jgi:hypothetical protein